MQMFHQNEMIKDEIVFEQFAQSYRASIKTTTQTTPDLLRINAWQILKQKVDSYQTEASMTCIKIVLGTQKSKPGLSFASPMA